MMAQSQSLPANILKPQSRPFVFYKQVHGVCLVVAKRNIQITTR
jgi:hypothetical protein